MGIIKNIIGAVLGLLAAIGGLVGIGGKGNGYVVDFREGQENTSVPAKVAAAPAPKAPPAPVAKASPAAEAAPAKNEAAASAKAAKAAIKTEKAAAKAAAAQVSKVAEADSAPQTEQKAAPEMTFADVMMVPTNTMAKRSPGPSLAGFQEMAKEMASKR